MKLSIELKMKVVIASSSREYNRAMYRSAAIVDTHLDSSAIRPVRIQDLAVLNKLFVQSIDTDFTYFTEPFKKTLVQQHNLPRLIKAYLSPHAQPILAWQANQAVGYCLLRSEPQSITYLHWMYIQPDQRGLKLGEMLLQRAIKLAESNQSRVLQLVTHDKESFYQRYNFERRHRIPGLIGGVDMTIMELELG